MGDRKWRAFLDMHDRLAQDTIASSRGRMLRTTGDGIMATFDSPGRAIDCAGQLRKGLQEWSVPVRAGVHTGEMEVRGGDVAGIGVVIAARIGAMAEADEILVSRTVVDLVAGSDRSFVDRGTTELKGVPGTWQIFAAAASSFGS
jgi:class 3 adenylate cyclase